ncbi:uncharacterized protein LOC143198028 isoform X2 [Rhynchophorus ferrugineus]|uniref:uncharacterized protein LOC143198028 isoform X2 n=1 Tax=Rhynchophorus ferrugineus TaxID=354439 RepID=UPI003FCC3D5D
MRCTVLYGVALVCVFVVVDVRADRRWKNDLDIEKRTTFNAQRRDDRFSKKNIDNKKDENQTGARYGKVDQPKRFIGRIEHGKVMVLRKKPPSSEEDHRESVCRKIKGNAVDCSGKTDKDSSSSEETKPKKKIKYSIKFKHEKQKKQEFNGDNAILRLHKNDRKYGKFDDDDDSSEEDDNPIKKPFHFMDDDDD